MAPRNIRGEVRDLAANGMVPIGALANEIGERAAILDDWVAGGRRLDGAIVARIVQFLDDRAFVARTMEEANNRIRQELAIRLIATLAMLASKMEHAEAAKRADLHDAMTMYLADLQRLVRLMGAEVEKLPERLAAALRSLLKPGDRLMIARAGNPAGRVGGK